MMKVSPDKAFVSKALTILLITLICCFAFVILLQVSSIFFKPTKNVCSKQVCLAKFMEGPPAFNDEALKSYLLKKFFYRSTGPLRESGDIGLTPEFEMASDMVKSEFENKKHGTFAVLGAGDGEYQDITLQLEKELGWTGLLVEPHPVLFEKLKAKGRNALLSSNCVSPYTYPALLEFAHSSINAVDGESEKYQKMRRTKLKALWQKEADLADPISVQCIPTENLLYAAGFEKELDLLVLSMSGSDLDVFMNVRLDRIPKPKMIVIFSHGTNMEEDMQGYFVDLKMLLKKSFRGDNDENIYIVTPPEPE